MGLLFHNDRDESLEEVVGSLHFASHSNQNSDTGGSDLQEIGVDSSIGGNGRQMVDRTDADPLDTICEHVKINCLSDRSP